MKKMTEDFVKEAVLRLSDDTVTIPGSPRSVVSDVAEEVKQLDVPVSTKVKLKKDLISDCVRLGSPLSKRKLGRLKKNELETHMAELFEQGCTTAIKLDAGINDTQDDTPSQNDTQPSQDDTHSPINDALGMDDNFIKELLFRLTLSCCNLVEYGTKSYSKYLGGMCLHQWSYNLERNQHLSAMMKDSLFEIYERNIEIISPLLTSEGKLMAALMLSGLSSIKRNVPEISSRSGDMRSQGTREDHCRHQHVPPSQSRFNRPSRFSNSNEQRNRNGAVGLDSIKEQPSVPVLATGRYPEHIRDTRAQEEEKEAPVSTNTR